MTGARDRREVSAFGLYGYEPGNGTRYDLTFAGRYGGGWLVAWEAGRMLAIVMGGNARRGGPAEVLVLAGELSDPDHEAIADLAGELVRSGALVGA